MKYYVSQHSCSIIHLNILSIAANLFLSYLENFYHRFTVIDRNVVKTTEHRFVWYNWRHLVSHRVTWKWWRCFSIYIRSVYVPGLTDLWVVSNDIGCIFVEITHDYLCCGIGVRHRPPNAIIVMFNAKLRDNWIQVSYTWFVLGNHYIGCQVYSVRSVFFHEVFMQHIGVCLFSLPMYLVMNVTFSKLCHDQIGTMNHSSQFMFWSRNMMKSSNGNIFRVTGLVWGIHRSPVNSPHKGQWRGTSMFSMICAWTNDIVNNHEVGDLRRHRTNYDVTVMNNVMRSVSSFVLIDLLKHGSHLQTNLLLANIQPNSLILRSFNSQERRMLLLLLSPLCLSMCWCFIMTGPIYCRYIWCPCFISLATQQPTEGILYRPMVFTYRSGADFLLFLLDVLVFFFSLFL